MNPPKLTAEQVILTPHTHTVDTLNLLIFWSQETVGQLEKRVASLEIVLGQWKAQLEAEKRFLAAAEARRLQDFGL